MIFGIYIYSFWKAKQNETLFFELSPLSGKFLKWKLALFIFCTRCALWNTEKCISKIDFRLVHLEDSTQKAPLCYAL